MPIWHGVTIGTYTDDTTFLRLPESPSPAATKLSSTMLIQMEHKSLHTKIKPVEFYNKNSRLPNSVP